jgi:hypothetical protein
METNEKIRRCFIIGPMRDMTRLRKLKDLVVEPLLGPLQYTVTTPDEGSIGNIMQHVLLNLEQADLLIADVTWQNPNVMYELGIYHSFGKPYIMVMDSSVKDDVTQLPFDISPYWFELIDFNDIEGSKAALWKRINAIRQQMSSCDYFKNPITDFYTAPIAEIPTAVGLSKNYIKNFLARILPDIFQLDERGISHKVDVRIAVDEQGRRGNPEFRKLTKKQRATMTIQILIPIKLHMAQHDFIAGLSEKGKKIFRPATIGKKSRPFELYYKLNDDGHVSLIDIPTALSTLNDSIKLRRKLQDQVMANDWEILEGQELERFAYKCDTFKRELEKNHPECTGRVSIEWRWDPGK